MGRQRLRRAASGLSRAGRGLGLGAGCVLALLAAWPCAGGAVAGERPAIATPLGTVNLNPFHLPWGVPVSHGAHVVGPGSSELVVSLDMASHFRGDAGERERVLIDGETWRQSVSLRRGLGDGWEYLVGLSAVWHGAGVFDGFIEGWHDAFGLPQSGRDRAPRDRFSVLYARDGETLVDLGDEVSSLGDVSLGVGRALPNVLSNDGLVLRAAARLPAGEAGGPGGCGCFSGSVWGETSGSLSGSDGARDWLYAATLGVLAGEAPDALSAVGGRLVAFGRFGVTWRGLAPLSLTVQLDVHGSPYGGSALSPLSDAVVMIGLGGSLPLGEGATLEVAVTEDDGTGRSAPDIGLHTAVRWRL